MTIADEIERLEQLRRQGLLSEEEFQQAKTKALYEGSEPSPFGIIQGMKADTWCMLMHLSQLLSFSGLGILVPIVMWAVSKDQSEQANQHGIVIINWMLSELVYGLVAGILCIVLIGIPLLIVLAILMVVFPIIGAMKANQGIRWEYPFSIEFIKPTYQTEDF